MLSTWQPFSALTPDFVLRRARQALGPPPGVTLTLAGTTLRATGSANHAWIAAAAAGALHVPGVEAWEAPALVDLDQRELTALRRQLEARVVLFAARSISLAEPARSDLAETARLAAALLDASSRLGQTARIAIVGHASAEGPTASNRALSLGRAEAVRVALIASGLPAARLVASGAGVDPATPGDAGRRVDFAVAMDGAP